MKELAVPVTEEQTLSNLYSSKILMKKVNDFQRLAWGLELELESSDILASRVSGSVAVTI